MALEKPPKYLSLNPEGVKSYRPSDDEVYVWHTVRRSSSESWLTLEAKYRVPAARIIQLNFPGASENGRIVPEIVNWYLRHHKGFNCPETRDRKNRRFKGGEKVAIPFVGKVEIGEPIIRERLIEKKKELSNLWLGLGESHSGDLVIGGYFNWNARVYRAGTSVAGNIEWVNLISHGYKLGGGLGGSIGAVAVFAHGIENVSQFTSDFTWGNMDFDLAFGGQLGSVLKGLKGVGTVVEKMDEYKKLSYVAQELAKNRAFIKRGVYTIPIPLAGGGIHIWVGRKYGKISVVDSGTGI